MNDKLNKLIDGLNIDINVLAMTASDDILMLLRNKFKNIDVAINAITVYDFIYINNNFINEDNLELLWDLIAYNAVLYIDNFNYSLPNINNKNCINFIKKYNRDMLISKQMRINGKIEQFAIIKCYNKNKYSSILLQPNTKPIVIVCVLKIGGIYTPQYVNNLAYAVNKHLTIPYQFVCMTDAPTEEFTDKVHNVIPFVHYYPKWWGKIELFRNNLFSGYRVVYFDLDTLIIDNIDFMYSYSGIFCGLRDFYHMVSLGSGVMCWDGDDERLNCIYTDFISDSQSLIKNNLFGDQQWINTAINKHISYLQDYFPKKIVSFKKDCFIDNEIIYPEESAIVCFHGPPRIHELEYTKIKEHWISNGEINGY